MVRMLFSVLLPGIAGAVAISMLIPLFLVVSLPGLVPEGQVPAVSSTAEGLWLMIIVPLVLFLTGAAATRLARKSLRGLTDSLTISLPAGIIALLPGMMIFMDYIRSSSTLLLAGFSSAMLLAGTAGSFAYFYFYRIRPARRRHRFKKYQK